MPVTLLRLWRRWRAGVSPGATATATAGAPATGGRYNEAQTDWMPSSRPAPPFRLDTGLDAPSHVPGWMAQDGSRHTPRVTATPLADASGLIRVEAALGQEAALADHYRSILSAAPEWRRWRARHRGCFDIFVVIAIEGEHDLRLDMFNGAVSGAIELLAALADADAPATTLYDNLDQGWALQMVSTADEVFSLEWDPDRPAADDCPRALRFSRRELAAQASEALARLRQLHGRLVQDVGADLWNQPAAPQGGRPRS